ncbi:MAG TPA: VOC family protein [Blastocatellia bacterium]|nr:VOC family protein [Blastocatellia bacterium]
MSDNGKMKVGSVTWADLTVDNADDIRDFYSQVVGWRPVGVDMGGYDDYCMNPPDIDKPVVGICHARGGNQNLPAQWLIYITVEDLDNSVAKCVALGGEVIAEPRDMGEQGRYCVIRDPAGAVCGLFETAK